MAKHTPLIRLQAARTDLQNARENCPHWDYEGEGEGSYSCCYAVMDALDELRLAKKEASNG